MPHLIHHHDQWVISYKMDTMTSWLRHHFRSPPFWSQPEVLVMGLKKRGIFYWLVFIKKLLLILCQISIKNKWKFPLLIKLPTCPKSNVNRASKALIPVDIKGINSRASFDQLRCRYPASRAQISIESEFNICDWFVKQPSTLIESNWRFWNITSKASI